MLNVLLYRVPIEAEITEAWIEMVRKHCKMKPERLAELRAGAHARHWPRMLKRRRARLAYVKEHGREPSRWKPLLPGEQDHTKLMLGALRYRTGGLASLKARMRKHPDTWAQKLSTRFLSTKGIQSESQRLAALDDVQARNVASILAKNGKLTLKEYEALQRSMLPDNALSGKRRLREPIVTQEKTAMGE
jgi:hypothetical protein